MGSGVSAKDLKRGPTKSLKEVQNDLRALKLVHMTVIDTSLVFPHYYGMPFRRSLKSIVQSYLKREIQAEKVCGHDSYDDARSGVELMLWKVQQDFCQPTSSTSSPRPPTSTGSTGIESVAPPATGACGTGSS